MSIYEKIIEELRYTPGLRLRYIEALTNYPLAEKVKILSEMEVKGLIYSCVHQDLANMEYYNKWYAAE